jgi:hypothetical protein
MSINVGKDNDNNGIIELVKESKTLKELYIGNKVLKYREQFFHRNIF